MTRQNNKALLYFGSFVLPALILLSVFAFEGFAPFGDKSLLIMDMSGQYVEFYSALKYGDIFFSWSKSLGTNYIGVFAYYVSSPFSLLTLFFSDLDMPLCMLLLTILKIGFAGLNFSIYCIRRFPLKGMAVLVFSCAYALMSYNLVYSMCLMWLDGVIWLPIMLLGVEHIIADGRWKIFFGSLAVSLISNYYISYMLILFTGLYFVGRCFEERLELRTFLRCTLTYVFSGCVAAGVDAVFLLPAFLSHFDGKLAEGSADYASLYTFTWPDFFHKLFIGGYDSIKNNGTPFVYCSFFISVLALIFFLLPDISWQKKVSGGAMLIFMALSMWLAPLDKIWHAFQHPNWFPYRYSFLFSFVLILLACQTFTCFSLYKMRFAALVLAVAVSVNLITNAHAIFQGLDEQFGYQSISAYRQFRQDKARLLENLDGFFRIGSTEGTDRTMNDALSFDYNGVTHYSSSYLSSVNSWLKRYGLAQNYIWSSGYGSTPLVDLFFGIKYVVSDSEPAPGYDRIAESNGMALYQNPNFSSIAFFASSDAPKPTISGSVFGNQNSLFNCLTGLEGELFKPIIAAEWYLDGYTWLSFVSDGRPVFCHFARQANKAVFYVNGEQREYLFTDESDCVQYLGSFAEGTTVMLVLESGAPAGSFQICGFDSGLLAQGVQIMSQRSLNITDHSESGRIKGVISCGSDGVLVTSIPYAAGWSAYVDGRKVAVNVVLDTFIAVPLNEGVHEIKLKYTPPGLMQGLIISAFTILIQFCINIEAISARCSCQHKAEEGGDAGIAD